MSATTIRFPADIPEGKVRLACYEEVAGISFRIENAVAFAKGRNHRLELEREPGNAHDPNAIKVLGVYKGWVFEHRVHIGYVPADLASLIAERGIFGQIEAYLRNIWHGGYAKDSVHVNFDIFQPEPPEVEKPKRKRAKKGPSAEA